MNLRNVGKHPPDHRTVLDVKFPGMLCRQVRVYQRFGGMYCLHLQGRRVSPARKKQNELYLVGKPLLRDVTKSLPRERLISHVNTDDLGVPCFALYTLQVCKKSR
jgi:hypothetical protein